MLLNQLDEEFLKRLKRYWALKMTPDEVLEFQRELRTVPALQMTGKNTLKNLRKQLTNETDNRSMPIHPNTEKDLIEIEITHVHYHNLLHGSMCVDSPFADIDPDHYKDMYRHTMYDPDYDHSRNVFLIDKWIDGALKDEWQDNVPGILEEPGKYRNMFMSRMEFRLAQNDICAHDDQAKNAEPISDQALDLYVLLMNNDENALENSKVRIANNVKAITGQARENIDEILANHKKSTAPKVTKNLVWERGYIRGGF